MFEVIVDRALEFPLYSSEPIVLLDKELLLKFISDNIDDEKISLRVCKIQDDVNIFDEVVIQYSDEVKH